MISKKAEIAYNKGYRVIHNAYDRERNYKIKINLTFLEQNE